MIKERHLNIFVLGLLIFVPIFAYWNDQPFTITLMTRAVIFAIAAVGLNLALGIGGFISFGHAAFFCECHFSGHSPLEARRSHSSKSAGK